MGKQWFYEYGGNVIRVESRWFHGQSLHINGVLVDREAGNFFQ